MPRFEPFAGLRYSTEIVGAIDDVSCPPYDVISRAEHKALLARSPYNVVRLEMPDDPDSGTDDTCYAMARALLDEWRARQVLRRDPTPVFYGYRTTAAAGDRPAQHTVGVIGALGLETPGAGILPHEYTTPKAKTDRRSLLEQLRVNVSPIWGLTPTKGLAGLTGAPPLDSSPDKVGVERTPSTEGGEHAPSTVGVEHAPSTVGVEHAFDGDGVLHELWAITDAWRIDAIRDLVSSQPVVLADGHHRYETALAYHEARATEGVVDDSGSDALMAYIVELSEEQLHVQAIHRLVSGLAEGSEVVDALRLGFTLEPTSPADATITTRMRAAGALGVITRQGTWLARPSTTTHSEAGHDLDSSRLDVVLAPLPGVVLTYQHGWENVAEAVRSGLAQAAVLLRPATVPQIAAISQGGDRMPPKTTFFWPKPLTGLVLRELDA